MAATAQQTYNIFVHCAVCLKRADEVVQHDNGLSIRFYARCHGEQEEFRLPLGREVVNVFTTEALRRKVTQIRRDHAVKRRAFLSAKRNGWKAK